MFGNQGIKQKMFGSSMLLAFALLAVGGVNLFSLWQVQQQYKKITGSVRTQETALHDMGESVKESSQAVTQLGLQNAPEDIAQIKSAYEHGLKRFQDNVKAYTDAMAATGKTPDPKLDAKFKAYTAAASSQFALVGGWGNKEDRTRFYETYKSRFVPAAQELVKAIDQYAEGVVGEIATLTAQAEETGRRYNYIVAGMVFAGFMLSMGLGYWFSRTLTQSLQHVVQNLLKSSEEVAHVTQQINTSSEKLSAGTVEQAASIEETAASVEEITAMVKRSAENADKSKEISAKSHETATRGKEVVEQMIQAIGEIHQSNDTIGQAMEQSSNEISAIVTVISEIGAKTKVINDIVFQTKLLSFNASVEAARAGEHGKGFAVVAEEVGNLAQMSGNAAKEISAMLDTSIEKVESIVKETREKVSRLVADSQDKVKDGTEIARKCGETLEEIVHNVDQVNTMIGEISVASNEQATGINSISGVMSGLDQATQQNAGTSQEAAAAASKLSGQVKALKNAAEELMKVVNGGATATPVRPVAKKKLFSFPKRKKVAKKAPAPAPKAKVVELRPAPTAPKAEVATKAPLKKASGGFDEVPSEDDPRFEEV